MKTSLFLSLFFSINALAQQPSPIGMLYNPKVNRFAISGIGGGNLYEYKENSTSGQVAIDWNISLKDENDKKLTLTPLFKYNPFSKRYLSIGDTLDLRKIAFVDNEFKLMFGLRLSKLRTIGTDKTSKLLNMAFFDFGFSQIDIENSTNPLNKGFYNFNINCGYQFGFLTNTDFGIVGLTISPQVNYISLYDYKANGTSFQDLNFSTEKISTNFLGAGFKISVPLNDFCFYFETRKYIPLNTSANIEGLTDRVIFSFGGLATGTIFKSKTKESE